MNQTKKFKYCLYAQVGYLLIAIGYNLLSYWQLQSMGHSFIAGSNPMLNNLNLLLILIPFTLAYWQQYKAYVVVNSLLMAMLFKMGVWQHALAAVSGDTSRYDSMLILFAALAVNVFGVVVGILASFTAWQVIRSK